MADTGVSGLSVIPALTPEALIFSIVATTSEHASTWTVIISAPALTNSSMYLIGSLIIRCTSNTLPVTFLIDLITGIPKDMLGTNNPSITSTWMYSAPASSIILISSPNLAKSADRIEGDKIFIAKI